MACFPTALMATLLMCFTWAAAESQNETSVSPTSSNITSTPLPVTTTAAAGSTIAATEAPGTEKASDNPSLITTAAETTRTSSAAPAGSTAGSTTPTTLWPQTTSGSNVTDNDSSTAPLPTSANGGSIITVTLGVNSTVTVTTIQADSNSTGYNPTNQTTHGPILNTPSSVPTGNTTNGTSTLQPNTPVSNISTSTIVFTTSSSYNGTSINTSLNGKDLNPVNTHGSIVFGVVLGSTLAILSAVLLVYILCKRNKSELFSHHRMYDNLPNNPVLRLENTTDAIDLRYQGGAAYYNPAVMNEISLYHPGQLENVNDVIQMDYMTPSHSYVA